MTPRKEAFENILGKGENAGNQHFLPFPKCFLPFPKQILIFQLHLFCCLQMHSICSGLKFCCLVKSYANYRLCYFLEFLDKNLTVSDWLIPLVKPFGYLFTTQSRLLMTLRKEAFENISGKGENADNQHFLLFPKCFSTIPKTNFNFLSCIYFVVCKSFQLGLV